MQRENARKSAELARRSEEIAEKKEKEAKASEELAKNSAELARKTLYMAKIHFADSAWNLGDVSEAWRHLDGAQWNLRGWEHDYLYSRFTRGQTTVKGHSGSVSSVAFSPDGKRIVSGSRDTTLKVWLQLARLDSATASAQTAAAQSPHE